VGQNLNTNYFIIGLWETTHEPIFDGKGVMVTGIIANVLNSFKARYKPLLLSRGEYMPTGTLRDSEIVGAIADAIGRNVGKLKPQVIRKDEKGLTVKNDTLARLLTLRPCPEMSTYDFLYRIAVDLVYTSNSFSVIFWNDDFTKVTSVQPIATKSFRIFEDNKGNILFRFRWDYDGETYTIPYQSVIHIKARYNKKRFLGTTPDVELKRSLDLIETSGEALKNIVNRSGSLAGYLRYNNLADDEELKQKAKEFADAYMNAENAGGVAAIDNSIEFKEINQRTPAIPTTQISFLRDNVYRYYGVNEKILTSTLTDQEFMSFYENVIEPIAVQLSYEFTFKLLTPREIGYGNRIDFVANLLQYATLQTRETIGGGMFDRGALTINEYRELMYYGPVEDGDQRLISLNYVKAGDQSLYQVGRESDSDTPPDDADQKDKEQRAIRAAARAYMQIMKGG
jgi:HK97 family phage portal protein